MNSPQPIGLPDLVLVNLTEELAALEPTILEVYDGELLVGKAVFHHDGTKIQTFHYKDTKVQSFSTDLHFVKNDYSTMAIHKLNIYKT